MKKINLEQTSSSADLKTNFRKALEDNCFLKICKSLNLPELILLKDYFGWWWWWWSAGASVYPYICQSSDCRCVFEHCALYTIPGGLWQFLQWRSLIRGKGRLLACSRLRKAIPARARQTFVCLLPAHLPAPASCDPPGTGSEKIAEEAGKALQ